MITTVALQKDVDHVVDDEDDDDDHDDNVGPSRLLAVLSGCWLPGLAACQADLQRGFATRTISSSGRGAVLVTILSGSVWSHPCSVSLHNLIPWYNPKPLTSP